MMPLFSGANVALLALPSLGCGRERPQATPDESQVPFGADNRSTLGTKNQRLSTEDGAAEGENPFRTTILDAHRPGRAIGGTGAAADATLVGVAEIASLRMLKR